MGSTADAMSIAGTLPSLTDSLQSANTSVPTRDVLQPPEDGISLFDAKNEIFLSYLQSLALRNLELIRDVREIVAGRKALENGITSTSISNEVVDDLIRRRVYLEKGVRPLEERLKYTVDKVVRAAAEGNRGLHREKEAGAGKKDKHTAASEDDEDDSEGSSSGEEETFGPNQDRFQKDLRSGGGAAIAKSASDTADGVYRPPRVTATSMPENFDRASRRRDRPDRSRTLDEYVSSELADGPTAQPSIGAEIAQGGRRQISARERAKEQERRDYEETHLTRLPKESKKEKGKKRAREGGFGGEDWRGLGDDLERINSLTKGVKRKDKEGALERSRKRRATEDSQRQDGIQGGLFDKRKKRMMKKLK
ncbi:hypothetical protein ANO11243_046470 [Dothideomycetidae sp. 11243]|nr:hypothetical protein ANO11243_046470 [fungal sp. No.11243]